MRERLRAVTALLEAIDADRSLLEQCSPEERQRLQLAVAAVYNPDPVARRRMVKSAERERSAARAEKVGAARQQTGIRELRRKPVFTTPNYFPPPVEEAAPVVDEPQHCYVCKQHYTVIHHFYDQMCPGVRGVQFRQANGTGRSAGRVALLTGGRVKIGYQAGLKLLRAGAELIVTTRFPRDSAKRYAEEPDFAEWGHRLEIFGLDLRHTPSVEAFCRGLLATRSRLDFVINNACQTVRRPPEFYRHMMEGRGSRSASCRRSPASF